MMKKLIYTIAFWSLCLIVAGSGCKKESNPYIDSGAPPPTQVSGINITNTPGGALLTYKIPDDPNLSYVKAVYEIRPGIVRTAKSSYYTDTLALLGFGDTLSHDVQIYSVGRNDKTSEPLSVAVNPLTPPVKSVFKSLTLEATFGGVIVSFQNPDQADLAIHVMVDTTGQNTWSPATTYYTAAASGKFAARGFDSVEKRFAVYIQDHWDNYSDTLIERLTPFFEEMIPKNPFKVLPLQNDFWQSVNATYVLEKAWDGIANVSENIFATKDYATLPQWFTVDLGQSVVFSRMKLYQRTSYPYNSVWIKSFEVWGSNTTNADWDDSWQLLGHFESAAPSGLPWPQYTADDMVYEKAGEDYTFPQPSPAVKYIRFKVLSTYGGKGQYQFGEFTFWGQVK